jgi:hypothetical protein
VQQPGERRPAFEHVIHRLCDIVVARKFGAFLTHPALKLLDQRRAESLTDGETIGLFGQGRRDQDDADALRFDPAVRLAIAEARGTAALCEQVPCTNVEVACK